MSTPRFVLVAALVAAPALAQGPNLGQPISEAEVKAWDISILPDGTGLPPAARHPRHRLPAPRLGNAAAPLVGGAPLKAINTPKTIANFWGDATTVFDFIRRAMPWQQPRSLSDDEVYALTAYILAQNKLIGGNETMNAQTLPQVKMPNRDNFILRFPDRI